MLKAPPYLGITKARWPHSQNGNLINVIVFYKLINHFFRFIDVLCKRTMSHLDMDLRDSHAYIQLRTSSSSTFNLNMLNGAPYRKIGV